MLGKANKADLRAGATPVARVKRPDHVTEAEARRSMTNFIDSVIQKLEESPHGFSVS
jgi:hypothetical protein